MHLDNLRLTQNHGGPIHYLGNRYLSLPHLSGHMRVDQRWLIEFFTIISQNTHGKKYRKCFEPFSGSASLTTAAMEFGLAEEYVINDSDDVLIQTHILMRDNPDSIKETYASLSQSYEKSRDKKKFFLDIIKNYNRVDKQQKSLLLPFIINHSWSGIPFHNARGELLYHENQIAGKIIPGHLEKASLTLENYFSEVDRVSNLFNSNKVSFLSGDFLKALSDVGPDDFIALNPPYPENERSVTEHSGMYTELYSPEKLHENLVNLIHTMENKGIPYFMSYGFYNPTWWNFVIRDKADQLKNYFRVTGYSDCAFGVGLDQVYLSPQFSIPQELQTKIIRAVDVLTRKEMTPEEALENFCRHPRERG